MAYYIIMFYAGCYGILYHYVLKWMDGCFMMDVMAYYIIMF